MFQHRLALGLASQTIASGSNATVSAFEWTAMSFDSFFYSSSGTPNYTALDPIMIRRIRVKSYYFDGYWSGLSIVRDTQTDTYLKVAEVSPVNVNEWLDLNMIVPGPGVVANGGDLVHLALTGSVYFENNLSASHTETPYFEAEIVYGEM